MDTSNPPPPDPDPDGVGAPPADPLDPAVIAVADIPAADVASYRERFAAAAQDHHQAAAPYVGAPACECPCGCGCGTV